MILRPSLPGCRTVSSWERETPSLSEANRANRQFQTRSISRYTGRFPQVSATPYYLQTRPFLQAYQCRPHAWCKYLSTMMPCASPPVIMPVIFLDLDVAKRSASTRPTFQTRWRQQLRPVGDHARRHSRDERRSALYRFSKPMSRAPPCISLTLTKT